MGGADPQNAGGLTAPSYLRLWASSVLWSLLRSASPNSTDLPHIFERFRRAANVVGRIAGTGIGLASARQIVEQHGGTLRVASVLGRGSTFTIRLPVDGAPRCDAGVP